jgi:chromate reductase, NAD(P)H dehydrogenase (quinone)
VRIRFLMISGSLRSASASSAALTAASELVPDDVEPVVYQGLRSLPHYNPDRDIVPLDEAVSELRAAIHQADAIVVSTPEYAGALPGSFKNVLDWTIGDDQPRSIYEKPVAWINVSPRGAVGAHEELLKVLTYAHADVVEEACLNLPVTAVMISETGLLTDATARDRIAAALAILADRIRRNGHHFR